MAEQYSVSHMTMRQALSVLVKDGLLRRQRGKGSIVVDRLITGKFAIVASPEMLSADASPFYRLTINALVDRLRDANPRYRASIHLGQAGVSDEQGFATTVDLLDPRIAGSMRGVFTFKPLGEVGETLEARGIPVITIGRCPGDWVIWFDSAQFVRQGINHLVECGCRRPGLIWGRARPPSRCEDAFDQLFAEIAGERGMEVRPEWVSYIENYDWTEQDGYDLFTTVWNQPKRPDSLLVTDDLLCRGVLRGILHFGVRVPEQLRLITQANEGVPLPYHLPVTRMEVSPIEFARQACEMMLSRSRGKVPTQKRVITPIRLVQGETTGSGERELAQPQKVVFKSKKSDCLCHA